MGSSLRLQAYCEDFDSLRGWFTRADAALLQVVNKIQQRAGVRGDILEIGAATLKSVRRVRSGVPAAYV